MNILFDFEKSSLYFDNPVSIINCISFKDVPQAFERIEEALARGLYVAGFFSYELGYAFEEKFSSYQLNDFPLIHIGCYKETQQYKNQLVAGGQTCEVTSMNPKASFGNILYPPLRGIVQLTNSNALRFRNSSFTIKNIRFNISKEKYFNHIDIVRSYLQSGDVYQITYCLKILFDFNGNAFDLYRSLFNVQPVPYAAFIETDQYSIASLSPELFLYKKGNSILSKPMKGTWQRGNTIFSDIAARYKFYRDEKNRAENIMITDLLRNDFGRIGYNIRVPRLCEVTPYKTLFQMTSTVAANIEPDVPLYNLFKSLFPSGSVTGAPKIRAMEIIHELEQESRKIYTGAIGYITPNKDLFINIPIRTALINSADGKGEMGIGGGIVWDSTAEGEWAEGILKAGFFTDSI
ncbi:MAG: chorismate-binding protein [Deltaproteobacteria bacterium]|nr:chorismate-binding protein [Deltaproteobacteria bacterium]